MKLFYYFLLWSLPKFTDFNKYFQSERVVITELNTKIVNLYLDILMCYMNRVHVQTTPVETINPSNKSFFIPIKNMYLGVNVMNQLNDAEVKKNPALIEDFLIRCQQFLITSCEEIKKRFDFNHGVVKHLTLFSIENALSNDFRNRYPSLFPIFVECKRFVPSNDLDLQQLIDDEWRQMPFLNNDEIKKEQEVDKFWVKLLHYKNALGEFEYKNIAQFVISLLCIPHANADCERIFSKINLIKTKQRNRLVTNTINGTLLASQAVKYSGNCIKFEPSQAMIQRNNINMYDHKKHTLVTTNTEDDFVIFD